MTRLLPLILLASCVVIVPPPSKDSDEPDDTDTVTPPDDTDSQPIETDETVETVETDPVDTDTVETIDPPVDTDPVDTDPVDTDPAAGGSWRHTVTVDGDPADLYDAERFDLGGGRNTWVTWDNLYVYVAVQHPDVVAGTARHWLMLTLGDGDPGARDGVQIATQRPALAFDATRVIRWKADNSYNSLLVWDGAAWLNTDGWLGTQGSLVAESNTTSTVELRLPRSVLGLTDTLLFHAHWVYEGAGAESSYAPTPLESFTDPSYDPALGAWYTFDLSAPTAPSRYAVSQAATVDTDPPETAVPETDLPETDLPETDLPETDLPETDLPDTDTQDSAPDSGGAPELWSHTLTLDGRADDRVIEELLPTDDGETWATWDREFVYVGVRHPDVATGGPNHWVLVTFSDDGIGAPQGPLLGTQQPGLACPAQHVLRWKADNSYTDLVVWDGTDWVPSPKFPGTLGPWVAERNDQQTVELRFPRDLLPRGARLDLHVSWVYEAPQAETSFAPSPDRSFPSGSYDPDYGACWRFDLRGGTPATRELIEAPVGVDSSAPVRDTGREETGDTAPIDTDPIDTDPVVQPDDTDVADTDPVVGPDDTDPVDTDPPVGADDTDVADTDPVDTDPPVGPDDTDGTVPGDSADSAAPADTDDSDSATPVGPDDTDVIDTDPTGPDDTDVADTDPIGPYDTDVADTDPIGPYDTDVADTDIDSGLPEETDEPIGVDTRDSDPLVDSDPIIDSDPPLVDTAIAETGDTSAETDPPADTDVADTDETDLPLPPPWNHPEITIDGSVTEWFSLERFTTSANSETWLSWDAERLLVGLRHPDVATGTAQHWLVVTLGNGGPGTATGALIGTQQPGLPFEATHILRYKLDGSYHDFATWGNGAWAIESNPIQQGSIPGLALAEQGTELELALPRDLLGLTGLVDIHVHLVFEGAGRETSFAATPSASFPEGAYNPDVGAWLELDLRSPDAPAMAPVRTPPEDTAPPPPWEHAITVDGDAREWLAEERFTSSAGTDTWVTWTAQYVFVAVRHPDVGTGGVSHWVILTLGNGAPGGRVGRTLNTQQPGIPFDATSILRWKADNSYNDLAVWNGSDWASTPGWFGTAGSLLAENNNNDVVEFAIPRAALGVTDRLLLHVNLVFEGAGAETSYAVVPNSSFPDGFYDPDYTRWYDFDLESAAAPSSYMTSP